MLRTTKSELETQIDDDMLSIGLNPNNKADIDDFWENKLKAEEQDEKDDMANRLMLEINIDFRQAIKRRRKEFMELLLAAIVGHRKAKEDLSKRFGVRTVSEYDKSSTVSVLIDGFVDYKA